MRLVALLLGAACATIPAPPCPAPAPCPALAPCPECPECPSCAPAGTADPGPAQAFTSLLAAVDAGDFAAAHALLSAEWRARYTPEDLAADFRATESRARERLERVRAALRSGVFRVFRDRAELPLAGGGAARAVREDGAWRVASLD